MLTCAQVERAIGGHCARGRVTSAWSAFSCQVNSSVPSLEVAAVELLVV